MVDEEHPEPDPGMLRLVLPLAAAGLAVLVLTLMVVVRDGPTRSAVMVGALVLQTAIMICRGLSGRRAGGLGDRSLRWHQFWFLWSVQAGVTYLWAGDDTAVSAAVYVATGFVFATLLIAWFRWADRPGEAVSHTEPGDPANREHPRTPPMR